MAEMDIETDLDNVLAQVAEDGSMDYSCWPRLLPQVVTQIEKIANTEFPIPKLNIPAPAPPIAAPNSSKDTSSSQDTNKENEATPAPPAGGTPSAAATGTLPKPVADMLTEITNVLREEFAENPPHTIQRVAELVLRPKQHYRHVVPWLHALDRAVHVRSGANTYPLPPAVADMSSMSILGNEAGGRGSAALSTDASTNGGILVGSDEALGGALLTPIPWLARRQNGESGSSDAGSDDVGGSSPLSASGGVSSTTPQHQIQQQRQQQHQQHQARQLDGRVRTESTETIEGPNGMGRIETVSISVNGIPSTGAGGVGGVLAQRGITQGELLRQEQRAGVVPMSQLARQQQQAQIEANRQANGVSSSSEDEDSPMTGEDVEAEHPHARGPQEIGAADTGPQPAGMGAFTVGSAADPPVEVHGINTEAAVGRPPDQTDAAAGGMQRQLVTREANNKTEAESIIPRSPKREATEDLEGGSASKRAKEENEAAQEGKPNLDAEGDVVLTDSESGESKEPIPNPEDKEKKQEEESTSETTKTEEEI
ncbi:hypothetical protein QBC38DRAFT_382413 [Podospora fimiseda]|uniref:Serine/threonine-protein phosphatase 4 regulatory subunit 2 n=1 Tax=Podospora fimiseda TaxID=252190 RepID=A0AAN7BX13_9PEZI|nr:hypothetical protein QBC38DRAFT_382413 [Podospora fimiseda]